MKKMLKRCLSILLVMIMFVPNNMWLGIGKVEAAESNATAMDYVISYGVDSAWEGAFNAHISIKNVSSSTIEDWCLEFEMSQTISNIWNAEIVSETNGIYRLKNCGYNQDIHPGEVVSIGFTVSGNKTVEPKNFKILNEFITVIESSYNTEFIVYSDWGNGFSGAIVVNNTSEEDIEDWSLEFDFEGEIKEIWNGQINSNEQGHFYVINEGYNQKIAPGNSITIGINGVRDNQNVAPHNMILHTYVYENKVNDEKIIDVDKSMMVEKEGKYYLNSDFNNLCGTLNTISVETFYYTLSDLDGKKVYADYIHVEDNWSVLNIPLLYGENRIELVAIKDNEIVEKYDIILINDDISKMNSINSFLPDSDDDGINDYLEMIYGTDPINSDTDGDGLLDGEEEELGMDPTKYDSNDNGISDGEESIPQIIKEGRYASTLYEDNMAIPSLSEVIAKGNINNSIRISEYNDYLKGDERAYVGKAIEIKKANISSATLSFTISESYEVKDYVIAGTKTNGLLICYNDYENTVPLDTVFDEKLRTVSAEITSDGIYFVVDAIDWIGSLGIDINSIVTSVEKVEDLTINENEFSDLKRMDSRTAENKTELSAVGDIIERKKPEVLCEAKDNNVKISEKRGTKNLQLPK